MIDLQQLLDSVDVDDKLDDSSLCEEMLRLLCSTVRRYNQTCEELERLKQSTGFDKPFLILRLPREIRDEIYTYCLRAASSVQTTPRTHLTVTAADYPFKPPTSGILRTNKQIYHEAIEIVYSKNIFKFREPEQLFAFEDQIGSENGMRVREVSIWIMFPHEPEVVQVLDAEHALRSEYDSVPSHWITALKACRLAKIVHLEIEAEMLCGAPTDLLLMPEDLQQSLEGFLGRAVCGEVPRLSLRGFREEEKEKFPKSWEVVMDQWDDYKDEIRGMQEELDAWSLEDEEQLVDGE